ncbi:hypothetical protein [Nodosilinea sp. FACHB-13]|uniref:hypothetical protein n=1 Tax=Cyanophyceae TaxID=3028117 RepID=UPI001682DF4E|nr:hypothetical protein [Nodosilinea sp. FACHB-13]MBD2106249.1 hypothetical protein [Nodosilinea sp. FACHB-13]
MQTRDYLSLWISDLEQAMNNLRHSFSSSDHTELESQLLELKNELWHGQTETLRVRSDYKNIVEQYLGRFKPFPSSPKSFENDVKTYIELVGHSIVLDDIAFLKKWGVEYPANNAFRVLAEPVSQYISVFKGGLAGIVPQNTSSHFKYLANELSKY